MGCRAVLNRRATESYTADVYNVMSSCKSDVPGSTNQEGMMFRNLLGFLLAALALATGGCATHGDGQVKGGHIPLEQKVTPETQGISYKGPQYNIAILDFENNVPQKIGGAGELAAAILDAQLASVGLNGFRASKSSHNITPPTSLIAGSAEKYVDSASEGFDYRVSGEITAYSEVEENIDTVRFQKTSVVSRVRLAYQLVDASSGNMLEGGTCSGEYRTVIPDAPDASTKSMFDPGLFEGALRDALAKATDRIVHKLSAMPFHGRLVSVDANTVLLRAGSRSQLRIGTPLAVYRTAELRRDPDSGEITGRREEMVGIITVTRHQDENFSEASVMSGSGFQIGEIARPLQ